MRLYELRRVDKEKYNEEMVDYVLDNVPQRSIEYAIQVIGESKDNNLKNHIKRLIKYSNQYDVDVIDMISSFEKITECSFCYC